MAVFIITGRGKVAGKILHWQGESEEPLLFWHGDSITEPDYFGGGSPKWALWAA